MTSNHVQGVFGEFKPVLDGAGGTFTANQVQGVFGEFKPVLDNAQTAGGGSLIKTFLGLANASTKTALGLANASVKTWGGLTNV